MAVTALITCARDELLRVGLSFCGHLLPSLLVPQCLIAELEETEAQLALDLRCSSLALAVASPHVHFCRDGGGKHEKVQRSVPTLAHPGPSSLPILHVLWDRKSGVPSRQGHG